MRACSSSLAVVQQQPVSRHTATNPMRSSIPSHSIHHPPAPPLQLVQGNICLNILREDWKPVLTITAIVYGLNFLFLVRPQYKWEFLTACVVLPSWGPTAGVSL